MTDFSGFDVFSEKAAVADADRVQLIDPELLYPDPENVRSEIDPAKIDEMAETIKERGQLQPITVAPRDDDGRYRIMFGERRWRACQKLGVPVRAIVSKTDDIERVRIDQFIENDQREDLSTADMIRFVTGQVAKGRSLAELAEQRGEDLLIVLLDGITDPRNFGAIIRSAEVLGAHGVVVEERRSAPLSPVVAKTAAGATSYLPVAQTKNLPPAKPQPKADGVWVYGAAGEAAQDVTLTDFSGKAALVIGAEGEGMRRLVREKCDVLVSNLWRGQGQSLTAPVAACLLRHEQTRGRGKERDDPR